MYNWRRSKKFKSIRRSGTNLGIQNSDLVLAIGSRISGRLFGGNKKSFLRGAKTYLVDIDSGLLQKKFQEVPFDVNIHSDAKIFLGILSDMLKGEQIPRFTDWNSKVREWKDRFDPVLPEYFEE